MILQSYLQKRAIRPRLVNEDPSQALGLIIVIPSFNELSILSALRSIHDCETPQTEVEVIVVFNASEKADETFKKRNEIALEEAIKWYDTLDAPIFNLYCLLEHELPKKHAGVGMARKIGMDEAVRRFDKISNEHGVIACFDADSQADSNYLIELERHFKRHPDISACSIYFEHPLEGEEYSQEIYQNILWYEMHLRYYKLGLSYAELPFAFHTVGSSMAVKAEDYCKEGGMNKRKAGEDFYFLQKFIDKGSLNELTTCRIIPSPRASDRVPFGTGRAILEAMEGARAIDYSYAFDTFQVLKDTFSHVENWYKENPILNNYAIDFFGGENFMNKIEEIRNNSSNAERFRIRFFQWFNGFYCLKFVHYLRDHAFQNAELLSEVPRLLTAIDKNRSFLEERSLLLHLRDIELKKE